MSTFANVQSWPTCALKDQRPLVKFWDRTFGSTSLEYEESLKLCEYYGFRPSVCDSPESLRQCLEIVRNLFTHAITFDVVHDSCKGAVMRFLGLSEPKNFQSGSVVRKLASAFSSFEEVLEIDFSDNVISSSLGKDVLRIFQAILGVPILDLRFPKAAHLGYLAHSQGVVKGEVGTGGRAGCTMGGYTPLDVSDPKAGTQLPHGTFGGWTLSLPHEDSGFYGTASDCLLLTLALLCSGLRKYSSLPDFCLISGHFIISNEIPATLVLAIKSHPSLHRLETISVNEGLWPNSIIVSQFSPAADNNLRQIPEIHFVIDVAID